MTFFILTKVQDVFYRLLKTKKKIWDIAGQSRRLQQVPYTGQTKTTNIDYFTIYLSSPTFIKIATTSFQEIFLEIFRKFCLKKFKTN